MKLSKVSWGFIILFLIVVLSEMSFIAISVAPKHEEANAKDREKQELLKKIERKREEIREIKDRQKRFKTDKDFVERIAREQQKVFPGEIVFIFAPDTPIR